MRHQSYHLPSTPTRCPTRACVYCQGDEGTCADPRLHKGNSDARCHRWSNKRLLQTLAGPAGPASTT